jgi:predicted DNA-binding helix-hairpin-helix protein
VLIKHTPDAYEKLGILGGMASDDILARPEDGRARMPYNRVDRNPIPGVYRAAMPNGKVISLMRVMFTDFCMMDCAYCPNSVYVPRKRYAFKVDELAKTFMELQQRHTVDGLFLSSGIAGSGSRTTEKLIHVVEAIRHRYGFKGYIHMKVMPGADRELVEAAYRLGTRLSVNLETPTPEHMRKLSSRKDLERDILAPMSWIDKLIKSGDPQNPPSSPFTKGGDTEVSSANGEPISPFRKGGDTEVSSANGEPISPFRKGGDTEVSSANGEPISPFRKGGDMEVSSANGEPISPFRKGGDKEVSSANGEPISPFRKGGDKEVSSANGEPISPFRKGGLRGISGGAVGQATQLVVGAADESDWDIFRRINQLYTDWGLKRVYYAAFRPVRYTPLEEHPPTPMIREHRLYQMDWLKRVYRFSDDEMKLAFDKSGFLSHERDPKTTIAVENLDAFPLDVNSATHEQLLRVPGVGPISAERIVQNRRQHSIDTWRDLQAMGVVKKRAWPFLVFPGHRPPKARQLRLDLFGEGAKPNANETEWDKMRHSQQLSTSQGQETAPCGQARPCVGCPMYGTPGHPGYAPA